MAWDFSIEGAHSTTIRQRLLQGITQKWDLQKDTQTNLLALYQLEGINASFFDQLTNDLFREASLNIEEVLRELGFEEQYDRRSRQVNQALNQFFFHWIEVFAAKEGRQHISVHESSAFLDKETLIELVDWVMLCGLLLTQQPIPSYYKRQCPQLLADAQSYCEQVNDSEEMACFMVELPLYQRFQEELRTCLFDCFYWYNSY
ncbi:MAG: hypothetical protein ACRBFS_04170 [Aureispira sp.]